LDPIVLIDKVIDYLIGKQWTIWLGQIYT
jgi:hypothetical protein